MTLQKLTFPNKSNLRAMIDSLRQFDAAELNQIKDRFNANVDEMFVADEEDLTVTVNEGGDKIIKLMDRRGFPNLGYKIIRDSATFSSPGEYYENSIWEIREVHDLNNEEIVIPANVTLFFNGGKLTNYTSITGDNTKIISNLNAIFDGSGSLLGDWSVEKWFPQWFGAIGDGIEDDTIPIQKALDMGGECYLKEGTYTITNIELSVAKTNLKLSNNAVIQSSLSNNTAILVSADDCIIEGGELFMPPVFDAFNLEWDYAGIYITGANVKVKGVTLNNVQRVGIGFKNTNKCYVENCTINGNYGTYGSTYDGGDITHFGIAFSSEGTGGIFVARNNTINTCIQGINYDNFGITANGDGVLITGNNITQCFKHGINCDSGEGQIISNNNLSYCGMAIAVKCNNGATVSNNSILFGKTDEALSNEVGILLTDPYNVICSGNNINGNSIAGNAAIVLKNADENVISDNIITNNILKLAYGIASDAIQLGNGSTTVLSNNIISGNVIESSCQSGHGAVYVSSGVSVCFNNIIENNNITLHVLADADSAICVAASVGGLTIRNNNIVIQEDAGSAIAVYGIKIASTAVYVGEVVNNKISAFASHADNVNLTGVKVTAGTGVLLIEGNKMDASLSDALTYAIVSSSNANAVLKKNLNDLRVPASGIVTIAIAAQTAALPVGNFELEGSGLNVIKNILVRPINTGAVAEVAINQVWAAETIAGQPKVYLQSVATYACNFAWEII